LLFALAAFGLASCGDQNVTGQVPQAQVSVSCSHPVDGTPDVAVSDTPWVELLDRPDIPTLGVTEVTLVANGHAIPGRMVFQPLVRRITDNCGNAGQPPCDCSNWRVAFITDAPLSENIEHTATITTGVRLEAGQLVRGTFTWRFTTGDSATAGPGPALFPRGR
jgi:hypothetical protein